jgi:hypothetical protein
MAPGALICRHLHEGTSRKVFAVPPGEGQDDCDLLCPECVVRFNELSPADLVLICLHCRRGLMGEPPPAPTWDEFNLTFDRLCALKEAGEASGRSLDELLDAAHRT